MSLIKQKNLERFKSYTKDLLFFIKNNIDPRSKNKISHAIQKYIKTDKEEYLRTTLSKLESYIDFILKSDEIIFTPEYQKEHKIKYLDFLPGFDFRLLWRQNLTYEQKSIIFRYLTYIYLQSSMALGKNKKKVKAIVESLKTIAEIEKEAEENPNLDGEGGIGNLKDLFGDDSILLDIATELTQEVDLQGTLQEILASSNFQQPQPGENPMNLIGQMLNSPVLHEKIKGLNEKMQAKFSDREISEDEFKKSISSLQDGLANQLSSMIPGGKSQMKKMMKNMNLEAMFEQMQRSQSQGQGLPQASFKPASASATAKTQTKEPTSTNTQTVEPTSVEASTKTQPSTEDFQKMMNQMMTQNPQMLEMMNQMGQMANQQAENEKQSDAEQMHINHFQQFAQNFQNMMQQAQQETSEEAPKPSEEAVEDDLD